jgi:hypothetical protein
MLVLYCILTCVSIFSAIDRASRKYQTSDRNVLLGHLWTEYGHRQARAYADTPESNSLLSMDDCEAFQCGVVSLGRQAYGFMRRMGTSNK